MSDKKQQDQIEKLEKLKEKNLPENIQKSIVEKQKALENNTVIRK
jgi:hypothetical protein